MCIVHVYMGLGIEDMQTILYITIIALTAVKNMMTCKQ